MTNQELISKLQELKNIKPNQSWVVLSKTSIFQSTIKQSSVPVHKTIFSSIFNAQNQRKLVYAFAALLFVFVGGFGVLKYGASQNTKVAGSSQANVVAQATLKNNVADLKSKSQILAEVIKTKSQDPTVAIKAVKDAAKNLTDSIKKDPTLAKVVALDVNNSRSVLDIPGGNAEVKANSDDIYKTVDDPIIASIEKTELNNDQKLAFDNILKLYKKGNYSDALVGLLISFGQNGAESK